MIKSLSVYGIEIPESQMGEAMELLRQLIERENSVSSSLPITDETHYHTLSPSVRNDASRIMRRYALENDSHYQELRSQWHEFLNRYNKGVSN